MSTHTVPFWKRKNLAEMTDAEWESLCDGCAKCCLYRLEDEETRRIYFTNVHCRLLDTATARCTDYPNRSLRVPDCVTITPAVLADPYWLPRTCAYRLLAGVPAAGGSAKTRPRPSKTTWSIGSSRPRRPHRPPT